MELHLAKGEVIDLGEDLAGTLVLCRRGRCWITQTGDSRDYLLDSGDSFRPAASLRVVLMALTPVELGFAGQHRRSPRLWRKRSELLCWK